MRANPFFFYMTLMFLSAETMILEIVGAKALAPLFGSSHFVWISQIIITLLSISAGAYFSYKLEKKIKDKEVFAYKILCIPAIYIGITTILFNKISRIFLDFSLVKSSLFASILYYFIPLSVISLSYSLLISSKIEKEGPSFYGKLSSIGTVGNVLGTFVFGYYLVQNFSNQTILLFSSFGLWLLFSFPSFFSKKKSNKNLIFPLIIITLSLTLFIKEKKEGNEFPRILEVLNTSFGELKVIETETTIDIINNNILQGNYFKKDKKSAHFFSYALSSLTQINASKLDSIFLMGLGLGIVPNELRSNGAKKIHSVEINKSFVELSRKLGILKEKDEDIEINDGRYSLQKSKDTYDAIIVDAFLVDYSPPHLNTKEFYEIISDKLNSEGIMVQNSFGFLSPLSLTTAALFKTIKSVFPFVNIYSLNNANVFFVASKRPIVVDPKKYNLSGVPDELREKLIDLHLSRIEGLDDNSSIILTDKFNPIDSMDLESREKIRRLSISAIGD